MSELRKKLKTLDKFKYPLLILVLGLALMLAPSGGSTAARTQTAESPDGLLGTVLSCAEGVGRARVIVSESGVVVVCQGAGSADVRLDIIKAVSAYTGFSSDKITVLKMADAD